MDNKAGEIGNGSLVLCFFFCVFYLMLSLIAQASQQGCTNIFQWTMLVHPCSDTQYIYYHTQYIYYHTQYRIVTKGYISVMCYISKGLLAVLQDFRFTISYHVIAISIVYFTYHKFLISFLSTCSKTTNLLIVRNIAWLLTI